MEGKKFHVSVIAAVAHNQIWLAKGGIHPFCDLLMFLTDCDRCDIWNDDSIRESCSQRMLDQFPFLYKIDLCKNDQAELKNWIIALELEFGTHFEVHIDEFLHCKNFTQEVTLPATQLSLLS